MPPEMARIKYPSEQRPREIRMNGDGTVNFTFSLFEAGLEEQQIEDALGQFKSVIRKHDPGIVLQYNETDWKFAKRLASHFKTDIYPDSAYEGAKIYTTRAPL